MENQVCSNCGYEVDELTSIKLCQTCWSAYDKGYQEAKEGK